jgi:hypothetical protein
MNPPTREKLPHSPMEPAFWLPLLAEVSRHHRGPNDWAEWGTNTFADGTPIPNDPHTNFHLRSASLKRAVHFIVWPSDAERAGGSVKSVGAWLSTYGVAPEERGAYPVTDELALNLEANTETLAVARELLMLWLDPHVSVAAVERAIADHPRVNTEPEDAA